MCAAHHCNHVPSLCAEQMVLKDKLGQELCGQFTSSNQVSSFQNCRCTTIQNSDIWYVTVAVQKEEEQEKLTAPTAGNVHVIAQSTNVGLHNEEMPTVCHWPAQLIKFIKLSF